MSSPFHEGAPYENKGTKYNVYIVRDKDDVAISIVGEKLSGDRADKRSETALNRIDTNNFTPISEKVDSVKDLKYAADILVSKQGEAV